MTVDLATLVFGADFSLNTILPIGQSGSERDLELSYAALLEQKWGAGNDWEIASGKVVRQYTFPSGRRADIIVFAPEAAETLVVVELKRGSASHKHVAQLRRYMREARSIWIGWHVFGQIVADVVPNDVRDLNDDIDFAIPGPLPPEMGFQRGGPYHVGALLEGMYRREVN